MTTENKQRSEVNANPLNGRLARIERISTKHLTTYILHLDSGTKVSLPLESIPTINKVHFGDKFEFSQREDIVEGQLTRFDDQTRIAVKSTNRFSLSFIVTNDCIQPSDKTSKTL